MVRPKVLTSVLFSVMFALFLPYARAQVSVDNSEYLASPAPAAPQPPAIGAIEWQTDLLQAYNLSLTKGIPLVAYVYSDDGKAPLESCKHFEAEVLSSREIKRFRNAAVFVRWNAARDDENGRKFLRELNVTHVPSLAILECEADRMISRATVVGEFPKAEFMRVFRKGICEAILSKRMYGKTPCTDAEFVLTVELFGKDYLLLQTEFRRACANRREMLNKLSQSGEIDFEAFRNVNLKIWDLQSECHKRLNTLAELNTPEVYAYCLAQHEFHGQLDEAVKTLEWDLSGLNLALQFPNEFSAKMARTCIAESDGQIVKHITKLLTASDDAWDKIERRYQSLVAYRVTDTLSR